MKTLLVVLVCSMALGLCGCGSDDNPVAPPTTDAVVDSVNVALTTSPLVRSFTVYLDAPAGIQVDYWTQDSPRFRVESSVDSTQHQVLVPRLLSRSIYQYEVRAVSAGAAPGEPLTGSFVTGSLPSDLMNVRFDTQGETTTGLTLVELRSDFNGFVFIDDEGRVVWFWRTAATPQGSTRRENGNFVFIDTSQPNRLVEVSPTGDEVREVRAGYETVHHDVITTPRNTLLFLTQDATMLVGSETWVGDRVNEWNPETGVVLTLWDQWDHYDPVADLAPRSRLSDFGHANSLAMGTRGNVILSFNFLNQIISIAPNFRTIEWKLGGIGSDFDLPPGAVFTGQHTASELPNGNILCFDNRAESVNVDEWSRALEIALDETSGTAGEAWSFRPQPDNFARIISSARRLENGNTLVHFGTSGPVGPSDTGGPVETFEVTPGGNVVWRMVIDNAASAYRATPYTDIAGERVVEGP